jgi:hypothetical protein
LELFNNEGNETMFVLFEFYDKLKDLHCGGGGLQNITVGYMPKIEQLSNARVQELTEIKSKIRTSPQEVEQWFDTEIAKIGTMDLSNIFKQLTDK